MYFYLPLHIGLNVVCEVHSIKYQNKIFENSVSKYGFFNKILMPYDKNVFLWGIIYKEN